jgi:hypothetical protein
MKNKAYTTMTKPASKQYGAVLVTSLLLLLVMTMLALTGMQNSILNERMASNWQQRDKTFQVADSSAAQAKGNINHLGEAINNCSDTLAGLTDMNNIPRQVTTDYMGPSLLAGYSLGQGGGTMNAFRFKSTGAATQSNGVNSTVVHGFYRIGPSGTNPSC